MTRFSWIKWPEVYPTKGQFAYPIAKLLVEGVIARLGICSVLLSDRGSAFLSKLLQEVYEQFIKKANTTAYHPQTDGLVNMMRVFQTAASLLRDLIALDAFTRRNASTAPSNRLLIASIPLQTLLPALHKSARTLPVVGCHLALPEIGCAQCPPPMNIWQGSNRC